MGLSATSHSPPFAVVFAVCPLIETITLSPSSAVPNTFAGMSRCSTMLSVNRLFSLTSARVDAVAQTTMAPTRTLLIISRIFIAFFLFDLCYRTDRFRLPRPVLSGAFMGNLQNIVTALYRELETIPFVHKGSLLFVWEQVV
jgi:hypothetical protein